MKIKTMTTTFFLAAVSATVSLLLKICLETDYYLIPTYMTFGLLAVTVGLYAFYDVFVYIFSPKVPRMYARQIKRLKEVLEISNAELQALNNINTYDLDVDKKAYLSGRVVQTQDQIKAVEIAITILSKKLEEEKNEQ